jgi:hypothetical protein
MIPSKIKPKPIACQQLLLINTKMRLTIATRKSAIPKRLSGFREPLLHIRKTHSLSPNHVVQEFTLVHHHQ